MGRPLFSIITITFNAAGTLPATLKSVERQTFTDYEYLIVDGASTDGTVAIAQHSAAVSSVTSEPDKGLYDAMNKGLKMATGDIVGILNSDDFYTNEKVLEKVSKALDNKIIDAVYGDIHFVHDNDLKRCVRYYSSRTFRRSWMRLGFMPAHPSFYCRKIIYDKYGGFDLSYKIASDFECLLRFIFVHKIRTTYIPMDFVTMRTGGASTSGFTSHKQIISDHQKAFKRNGIYSNIFLESLRYIYKIHEILLTKTTKGNKTR